MQTPGVSNSRFALLQHRVPGLCRASDVEIRCRFLSTPAKRIVSLWILHQWKYRACELIGRPIVHEKAIPAMDNNLTEFTDVGNDDWQC